MAGVRAAVAAGPASEGSARRVRPGGGEQRDESIIGIPADESIVGIPAMERMTGIEPALSAWEAEVLPLNYIRMRHPVDAR